MTLKKSLLSTLAVTAACLSTLTSCFNSDGSIDYYAVQESEKGNWSFYGPDGEIKLADEFKNQPSNVVNGYFFVQEGNKKLFTLFKFGDKPKAIAEGLTEVGHMYDGLVPATFEGQRISLLDESGKVKFTLQPVSGKEITKCNGNYCDGMLAFAVEDSKSDNEKWGFVDTKGKVVIAPKYSGVSSFSEGLALVCVSEDRFDNNSQWAIIDKSGSIVKKFKPGLRPVIKTFKDGHIALLDTNKRVLIVDDKGETVTKLPAKVKSVDDINKDYIIFADEDDKHGVINYEGEVIIRAKYDILQFYESDRFVATIQNSDDNAKSVILNKDGDEELRIDDYKYGVIWTGKFGLVGIDKKTQSFIDDEGKARKNAEFHYIGGEWPNYIHSDYFDATPAINDILSLINDKGVDRYGIGDSPASLFSGRKDPENYTWRSRIDLDELTKEGDHYKITAEAEFSTSMADYTYSYGYYSWDYTRSYYWKSYCHLSAVTLSITSDKWDGKDSEKLAEALSKKGFSIESSSDSDVKSYCALLTKGDIAIVVMTDGVIVCQNNESTRQAAKNKIDEINRDTQNTDYHSAPELEYETIVCDSVAVVEVADSVACW